MRRAPKSVSTNKILQCFLYIRLERHKCSYNTHNLLRIIFMDYGIGSLVLYGSDMDSA
jgi:hypothetical protein